ncbi:hypothetical protein UFOVP244_132 [uncultured Caudovirales phage]|uniref:Uncharacterized protein n=1 Tax=uncultured Caudovirales phage TaxID=2100421 RepID=A0A6J7WT90_9CAUD|nr:hypothetical protein UFOVP244_132 [uncultured Caudovirales phage]
MNDTVMRTTPWRSTKDRKKLSFGVNWYEALEGSGLCVTKRVGDKVLSLRARSWATRFDGAYWFSTWLIPCYENPKWIKEFARLKIIDSEVSVDQVEKELREKVPQYFAHEPTQIIGFNEVVVEDLLYLKGLEDQPFLVQYIDQDFLLATRWLWVQKLHWKAFFSRVIRVERGNKELADKIRYYKVKHYTK